MFDAGHMFEGPGGQGYKLTRAVSSGEAVSPDMLEGYGGAPVPVAGELLPRWFAKQIARVTT